MVQRSRTTSIILGIFLRIFLFVVAVFLGIYLFPITIHDFVTNTLGYIRPSVFFGFTWADWDVGWMMALSLWIGVIFGTLGKRGDYIFIALFFFLASLDYFYTDNMTLLVYSGLVGATLLGNAIGFGLKLLRQKYFFGMN